MNDVRLILKNVDFRPAIVMDDVKQAGFASMEFPNDKQAQVIVRNCKNIAVEGTKMKEVK